METVNIHAAKTHLSRLIARVEAGEEIVIARGDKPVVKLVAMSPASSRPLRKPGALSGLLNVGPEFWEPLPEEELKAWEGG